MTLLICILMEATVAGWAWCTAIAAVLIPSLLFWNRSMRWESIFSFLRQRKDETRCRGQLLEIASNHSDATNQQPLQNLLKQYDCLCIRDYFSQEECLRFETLVQQESIPFRPQRLTQYLGCFDYINFPITQSSTTSNPHDDSSSSSSSSSSTTSSSTSTSASRQNARFIHHAPLPKTLWPFVEKLARCMPERDFNRGWLQRYGEGQFVSPHKDPGTYVGAVVIAVFGEFTGATTVIKGTRLQGRPGDVIILPGRMEGRGMPLHQVTAITSGTRYVFLLIEVVE